jgi:hypothetical protein
MQRELKNASPIFVDEEGRRWAKPARYAKEKGMHPKTVMRMAAHNLIKSRKYGARKLYLLDCIEP